MKIELDRLRLRIQHVERDNRRQKRIVLDRDATLAEYAIRERERERSRDPLSMQSSGRVVNLFLMTMSVTQQFWRNGEKI